MKWILKDSCAYFNNTLWASVWQQMINKSSKILKDTNMETKNSSKPTNCNLNFLSTKMQCILLGKEYNDKFKTKPKNYQKKVFISRLSSQTYYCRN